MCTPKPEAGDTDEVSLQSWREHCIQLVNLLSKHFDRSDRHCLKYSAIWFKLKSFMTVLKTLQPILTTC